MRKDGTREKYKTCSVVMAVYYADRPEWFRESVNSILGQTVKSDDIVVVRDGPVADELEHMLCEYEKKYKEISVVRLEKNNGLSNALNIGIEKAKNELIARMDADDISARNRFELQLDEFNRSSELALLGAQIAEFEGSADNIIAHRIVPIDPEDIVRFSKRRNPFNHPTVMYKKDVISSLGKYDKRALRCEDYDLWMRVIDGQHEARNLSSVVLNFRTNNSAIKRRKSFGAVSSNVKVRNEFYKRRYISFIDFVYGFLAQTTLLILPPKLATLGFKKVLRR